MLKEKLPCWGLLAGAGLALFYYSLFFDFSYDDFWQIHRNPVVTGSGGWFAVWTTPTPPGNLYRPLTTLTYKLTYALFGENSFPYHLLNLAIYLLVGCLVLELYLPFFSSRKAALVAALAFLVHPVHVEAVCNIVGRAELLAALFGGVCCLSFARLPWISAAALALGILSKESAVVFLALAPLYAHVRKPVGHAKFLKSILPLLLCAAAALLLRSAVLGNMTLAHEGQAGVIAENPLAHLSFFERILPALKVQGEYLRIMFMPIHLSADYSALPEFFLAEVFSAEGILLMALFLYTLFAIWYFRRHTFGLWGIWYVLAALPTANLFFPIGTLMGERLLFTPSIGLIGWFVALLARQAALHPRLRLLASPVTAAGCLLIFAAYSWLRIPVWENNYTLFSRTALDAPHSPKSAFNLAVELHKMGELDGAIRYFRACLKLDPGNLVAAGNLADIYLKKGQLGRVEYWYRYILKRDPQNAKVAEALSRLLSLKRPAPAAVSPEPPWH